MESDYSLFKDILCFFRKHIYVGGFKKSLIGT